MSAAEGPQKSVLVGELIAGKYRVDGVLGSGGMGVVLAATHLDLDRVVAVKLMRAELAEHPQAVDRLLREARLAAQFRGDHVCRVLDVGTVASGAPYIVMEYLEGSDLGALLSQHGPLEVETAVDFMLETAEALAEAHAANIIHRDLKPENLFVARQLDGSPCIKVLDFGISKQIGAQSIGRALTNPSAALGSPFYMAPEQMRSAKDVDLRADLWAVGAILFELLTGRQAFDGDTLPEVCGAVMSVDPPRVTEVRPEVPEGLSNVIARCLEKDMAQRYQSILEVALALVPFGSTNAEQSLERIERVIARRAGTNGYISLNPPLTSSRPSGVRTTPSGTRRQDTAPDPPQANSTSTLTAGAMEQPVRPGRLPWAASLLAILVLGVVSLLWLRRSASVGPSSAASSPVSSAVLAPSAERPIVTAPTDSARPVVSVGAESAAPPVAGSSTPSASAAHSSHTSSRVTRGVPVRASAAPPPARAEASAPAAPAAKKSPDAAAAWDSASFGPRH